MSPWWSNTYYTSRLPRSQDLATQCHHQVHHAARSSSWWLRRNGSDHVIVAWRLNDYPMLKRYVDSAALIAGGDTAGTVRPLPPPLMATFEHGVQIPFYQLRIGDNEARRGYDERPITVSGIWGAKKNPGAASVRHKLSVTMKELTSAAFKPPFSDNSALALYASSKFCFCPQGDNWQSKRLYTMILAGCVPIVCSDQFVLPLGSVVHWPTTAIRVPQAECSKWAAQNLNGTGTFPRHLWWSYHENVLRARARLTFDFAQPYAPQGGLHSLMLDAYGALQWRPRTQGGADLASGGEEPAPLRT